jgi:NADPH:quinone reductase-like Zn-dependent oxidoreductase
MELVDVPEPPQPGPGEVVVGDMAVGICGSDYHFFSGHLTAEAGGGLFPQARWWPPVRGPSSSRVVLSPSIL